MSKASLQGPLQPVVGRLRDVLTVYLATNIYGETCHFGVEATARAWAKTGTVLPINVRYPLEACEVGVDDAQSIKNLTKALVDVLHERDRLRNRLQKIELAAAAVTRWDWSDNDADCVADVAALADALNQTPNNQLRINHGRSTGNGIAWAWTAEQL